MRLSAIDAFFLAFQQHSGASMGLSVEVALAGPVAPAHIEVAVADAIRAIPRLGQRARSGRTGVHWSGPVSTDLVTSGDDHALAEFQAESIDPFVQPAFGAFVCPTREGGRVAFRCHHSLTDGQGFYELCLSLLEAAARSAAGRPPRFEAPDDVDLYSMNRLWRRRALARQARHLAREARAALSSSGFRLPLSHSRPGRTDGLTRWLSADERAELRAHATALGVTESTLVAAAWLRALADCGSGGGRVTLEMPVSARRGDHRRALGNFVAPVVVGAPATAHLDEAAMEIQRQLRAAVRDRAHLAVPLLSAPGKYLPWFLLRRSAAHSNFSGYATGHATWLEGTRLVHQVVSEASAGAVSVRDLALRTPVCVGMGATLTAMPFDRELLLAVTYRPDSMPRHLAHDLMERVARSIAPGRGAYAHSGHDHELAEHGARL